MKCQECQTENSENRKFCRECGAKLRLLCPQCSSENLPGDKYCGECGHSIYHHSDPHPKELSFDEKIAKIQKYLPKGITEKILSQKDRIEGERKQVTVMFCDMVGFTQLSEQLGPEEVYSLMDQVYTILIHKVHEFDGTVNEMTGDGIMALFGAPIALEDAPLRAIQSAHSIHKEVVRFSDNIKKEKEGISSLKMRIGINIGPVVVGTLGNDLRVEFKAVGDTVNLAARMEKLAEPGTTYVTEDTFKLTEGLFRFESLGNKRVKGKKASIKVYRVIAPSTVRTQFEVSAERGLTPLVGRERELELLTDGYERSKLGRGQVFSIMAEAGVGKSRLLYEFRKTLANEDVTFLEGKCLSYSSGVAYHPIIDILKSNFNVQEDDGDPDVKEKVQKGLKILLADEDLTTPYILELLSVADSGIEKMHGSAEIRKERILEALKHIVLKGAEIRPLIMAIEDLHWVDTSSNDTLNYLLESISGASVLLIFTYRPEFVETWGRRTYHSQVNLNRLSNREIHSMLVYLLGTDNIDNSLEELILEKTEGFPFFIEEFIKSLRDLKIIEKVNNIYRFTKESKTVSIPAKIQDVIMARIDSLPAEAKDLIQIGAVAGREFSHNLLKKIMGFPEQELLSYLSILKDSELLYERGVYPKSTYIIKHALIQDVAYKSLLSKTCRKYHRNIAQVLEEIFPDIAETQPELLAHHFTEAGLEEKAINYWQRAGHRGVKRSAHFEALAFFTKGLRLLRNLSENRDRDKHELRLRIDMGPTLIVTKGYSAPEVEKNLSQARKLCQKVGDTTQLFEVLTGLFSFHLVRAEYQTTYQLGEQLLSLAQRKQESSLIMIAKRQLGITLFWIGELTSAQDHLDHVIATFNPQQHYLQTFSRPAHIMEHCLLYGALIQEWLGYPDQAITKSRAAVLLANEISHPYSLATALFFSAWLHHSRCEVRATQELANKAVKVSAEHGFPFWESGGKMLLGWALAKQGKTKEGIALILQGLSEFKNTGAVQWQQCALSLLADAYGNAGQIEDGLQLLAEALDLVAKTDERCWQAELHRLNGDLFLALSSENQAKAEKCFRQAMDIARGQKAKILELKAALSISRLWRRQGMQDIAHKKLANLYGWFTEGFDTPLLLEAKALLDELV